MIAVPWQSRRILVLEPLQAAVRGLFEVSRSLNNDKRFALYTCEGPKRDNLTTESQHEERSVIGVISRERECFNFLVEQDSGTTARKRTPEDTESNNGCHNHRWERE